MNSFPALSITCEDFIKKENYVCLEIQNLSFPKIIINKYFI